MKLFFVAALTFTISSQAAAQVCPSGTVAELSVVAILPSGLNIRQEDVPAFEALYLPITQEVVKDLSLGETSKRNLRGERGLSNCQWCIDHFIPSFSSCQKFGFCPRRTLNAEAPRKLEEVTAAVELESLSPKEHRHLLTMSDTCHDARSDFLEQRLPSELDVAAVPGADVMLAAMEVHCYIECV